MPRIQRRNRRYSTQKSPINNKKCTICREKGHNRRTCWLKNVTFTDETIAWKSLETIIEQPSINTQNEDCPICMEKLDSSKNISITKCGHKFCSECLIIASRTKNDCPLCRQKLTNQEIPLQPEFTNEEVNEIIDDNIYYNDTIQSLNEIFNDRVLNNRVLNNAI